MSRKRMFLIVGVAAPFGFVVTCVAIGCITVFLERNKGNQ